MRIKITRHARIELRESAQYYEEKQQGLAAGFILEFEKTCERIKAQPKAGSQLAENIRYQMLRRFPYSIYYTETGQEIAILAVAHQHRKPGYWKNRK